MVLVSLYAYVVMRGHEVIDNFGFWVLSFGILGHGLLTALSLVAARQPRSGALAPGRAADPMTFAVWLLLSWVWTR